MVSHPRMLIMLSGIKCGNQDAYFLMHSLESAVPGNFQFVPTGLPVNSANFEVVRVYLNGQADYVIQECRSKGGWRRCRD